MHESMNSQKITGLSTNNEFFVCSIQESHSKLSLAIKQINLFGESTNTGTGPQEATSPKMWKADEEEEGEECAEQSHDLQTNNYFRAFYFIRVIITDFKCSISMSVTEIIKLSLHGNTSCCLLRQTGNTHLKLSHVIKSAETFLYGFSSSATAHFIKDIFLKNADKPVTAVEVYDKSNLFSVFFVHKSDRSVILCIAPLCFHLDMNYWLHRSLQSLT